MTKDEIKSEIIGIIRDGIGTWEEKAKRIIYLFDSQNRPRTWTDEEIQRIGDLEKRLEKLEGSVLDYQVVLDSICEGNLGSLGKFIEEAIKAAVEDRFNNLERSLKFEVGRIDDIRRNLITHMQDEKYHVYKRVDEEIGNLKDLYIEAQKQVNDLRMNVNSLPTIFNIRQESISFINSQLQEKGSFLQGIIEGLVRDIITESQSDNSRIKINLQSWISTYLNNAKGISEWDKAGYIIEGVRQAGWGPLLKENVRKDGE